jgi:hypothetical protein
LLRETHPSMGNELLVSAGWNLKKGGGQERLPHQLSVKGAGLRARR